MRTLRALGVLGFAALLAGLLAAGCQHCPVHQMLFPSDDEPAAEQASDAAGAYPITRPLHIYTLGDPEGLIAEYLEWIMSDEGQAVVSELGYVPVTPGTENDE